MDELWLLRDEIDKILSAKLAKEKNRLEARLEQLTLPAKTDKRPKKRPRGLTQKSAPSSGIVTSRRKHGPGAGKFLDG